MTITKSYSNKILNHLFGKENLEQKEYEIALFTFDVANQKLYEIQNVGYKRVKIPNESWERYENGRVHNNQRIIFNQVEGNAGINAIVIYEYPQSNQMLFWKMLSPRFMYWNTGNIYINSWDLEIGLN